MGWYKDRVNDHIDVNQAVRDAGKMGQAVAHLAGGFKNYADTKYKKKRARIEDAQKSDANATKKYVADKGYAGKVDSANIDAGAKDRATVAMLKSHKIDFNKEKYKTDGAYKKAIDEKILDIKKQKIATSGTLGAASIRAGASKYAADRGVDGKVIAANASKYAADSGVTKQKIASETSSVNNYRTTETARENSKRSAKTQLEVAKTQAKAAKSKKRKAKLKIPKDASYKEVEALLEDKKDFLL